MCSKGELYNMMYVQDAWALGMCVWLVCVCWGLVLLGFYIYIVYIFF